MIFSTTDLENEGRNAHDKGLKRIDNPYKTAFLHEKVSVINRVKRELWDLGYDHAVNDSEAV